MAVDTVFIVQLHWLDKPPKISGGAADNGTASFVLVHLFHLEGDQRDVAVVPIAPQLEVACLGDRQLLPRPRLGEMW